MKKKVSLILAGAIIASTFTGFGVENKSNIVFATNVNDHLETKIISGNDKLPNNAKKRAGAKDTLRIAMYNLGNKFLPIYASTDDEVEVGELIFDSLYTNDEEGNINVPELAVNFSFSSDNKSVTFTLRKNVKWSDGKPLTARDIENTMLLIADDSNGNRNTNIVERLVGYEDFKNKKINNIAGIKIIDDMTIIFNFKDANVSDFIGVATMPIMPAHIYPYERDQSNKIKALQNKMVIVGSGRYIFEKYDPKGILKLKANPNWYGGKVNVPNLEIVFKSDLSVSDNMDNGYLDIAPEINAGSYYGMLIENSGVITRHEYFGNAYGYIGLNMRDKRLSDQSVRQALAFGLNRQYFVDTYDDGYGFLCNSPIAMTSWAYTEKGNPYKYSVSKANQLLDKAGWKKGFDGIRRKNGMKLSFVWEAELYSNYSEALISYAESNWRKIGVEVKPHFMMFSSLADQVFYDRKFDMYNMSWSLSLDPSTRDLFHSSADYPNGNNAVGLRNAEIDNLLDEADREFDQKKRAEILAKYVDKINEQVPYIFLSNNVKWDLTNVRVKNYKVSPFCDWTYHIEQVEIQK